MKEIMARKDDWNQGISLYLRERNKNSTVYIAKPLQMEIVEDHIVVDPFVRLQIQESQQLMDELWQCGIRPTEGTGSAGSLRATEKHLEDMRKIVSKQLKVNM